jgi:predicted helicase
LQVLLPIWTEKHETAKRVAQRIKAVLDVAKSKGFYTGENPVNTIRDPRYPLELFQRVITVSLETMRIVNGLPGLEID